MTLEPTLREYEICAALRTEIRRVDPAIAHAMARALETGDDRLVGGDWGEADDQGCLLTLAARQLGLTGGEDLLYESIAAVRIPALFDELWPLLLERTGDTRVAQSLTWRLLIEALEAPAQVGSVGVVERAAVRARVR